MMDHNKDNLARRQAQDEVSFSEITYLPDVDFSPLLEQYIARMCERIKRDGISSLYWVTGINTREISTGLMSAMKDIDQTDADCCIVATPGESQLVEAFRSQYGIHVYRMKELYSSDSFVVVNDAAVLDVTPVEADDGDPEYNDDPTVVNLYIGLFNMFKSQSEE